MKVVLIFLGAILNLFAPDFIAPKEYPKMLYESPRGISCKKCRGNDESEQTLGLYMKNEVKTAYKAPSIQNPSFEESQNSPSQDKDAELIMPNYLLTNDEIITLYNYVKQFKKEQK